MRELVTVVWVVGLAATAMAAVLSAARWRPAENSGAFAFGRVALLFLAVLAVAGGAGLAAAYKFSVALCFLTGALAVAALAVRRAADPGPETDTPAAQLALTGLMAVAMGLLFANTKRPEVISALGLGAAGAALWAATAARRDQGAAGRAAVRGAAFLIAAAGALGAGYFVYPSFRNMAMPVMLAGAAAIGALASVIAATAARGHAAPRRARIAALAGGLSWGAFALISIRVLTGGYSLGLPVLAGAVAAVVVSAWPTWRVAGRRWRLLAVAAEEPASSFGAGIAAATVVAAVLAALALATDAFGGRLSAGYAFALAAVAFASWNAVIVCPWAGEEHRPSAERLAAGLGTALALFAVFAALQPAARMYSVNLAGARGLAGLLFGVVFAGIALRLIARVDGGSEAPRAAALRSGAPLVWAVAAPLALGFGVGLESAGGFLVGAAVSAGLLSAIPPTNERDRAAALNAALLLAAAVITVAAPAWR